MHRRHVRRVARLSAVVLLGLMAACSDSGSSGGSRDTASDGGAPALGAPCTTPDERVEIDGVPHICMLVAGPGLEWTTDPSSGSGSSPGLASSDEIPAVMQNWGFDLQTYDPATGMAGVMQIDGASTPAPDPHNKMDNRYLFMDYGVPNGSNNDLQMTFFLPLGTPVLSLVAGVVCDVPELYSGDFSVRVAPTGVECTGGSAVVLFETEHVLNPLVAEGDSVVAGQQVATVSDYHREWAALGMGVVEIGVFFAKDMLPWHACPARFLDPGHAEQLLAQLASIHAAWEAEIGDTTLYDEEAQSPLGCTSTEDVQG